MEAIIERCCGLDVHQASVVACMLTGPASTSRPRREVRRFGTFMKDLLELRDWLEEQHCTHVAMESTGVFWRPIYAVLEGGFELVVGNAFHMKNVPGRKTDIKDAEWIADLLRHGLIAKSFVPPKPIRELRDLLRFRRKLIETRANERNRTLKVLESANVKLSTVVTDVFGKSGWAMLQGLAAGESDTDKLASLGYGQMKKRHAALSASMTGSLGDHDRFLLRLCLRRLKALEADLATLDKTAAKYLKPYKQKLEALQAIPGVGASCAATIIAELGVDPTTFKSAQHLAAWAGVCPGNNESAGKQLGGRTRKGNPSLRTALIEATMGACRSKKSYFRDKYYRLKARRGHKRARMAIAHKILIAVYHVIFESKPYTDLGADYLDRLHGGRAQKQLVGRLERLGFQVSLTKKEPESAAIATS
jgi:transposase